MGGKSEWRAHGLPVEGELAEAPTAGSLARDDVVTCGLTEPVGRVRSRIEASPYGFGFVLSDGGILLGRLRRSSLAGTDARTAEEAMEPGPSTVRADAPAHELGKRLAERDLRTAVVTTPEGRMVGVVRREDLAQAG